MKNQKISDLNIANVKQVISHQVPVQLGVVCVIHYGLQPSLKPGLKPHVIL